MPPTLPFGAQARLPGCGESDLKVMSVGSYVKMCSGVCLYQEHPLRQLPGLLL